MMNRLIILLLVFLICGCGCKIKVADFFKEGEVEHVEYKWTDSRNDDDFTVITFADGSVSILDGIYSIPSKHIRIYKSNGWAAFPYQIMEVIND